MIRLKGGDDGESDYMADKMTQSLLGGGAKKKTWGQDNWLYEKPQYENVSIRSKTDSAYQSEIHTIHKSDKNLNKLDELKPDNDDSDDDLFGDMDDELDRIHNNRLAQLQKQGAITQKYKNLGHGTYNHINEREFLPCVTESKYAVVHFYHNDFERCKIVDKHLKELVVKYLPVKFAYIDAEKTHFFVNKLQIQVLPTIVLFKDGVAVDRIIGFSDFAAEDECSLEDFEERLKKKGNVMQTLSMDEEEENEDEIYNSNSRGPIRSSEKEIYDYEDDSD